MIVCCKHCHHDFHSTKERRVYCGDQCRDAHTDRNLKRERRRQAFMGLRTAINRYPEKYVYVRNGNRNIRQLTTWEIREFRIHIQRILDPESVAVLNPTRRCVV